MVSDLQTANTGAYCFHDRGSLMAAHHRKGCFGEVPESHVFIGMAKPGVGHLDEDFLVARILELEFVDDPRTVHFVGNCSACLHEVNIGANSADCHTSGVELRMWNLNLMSAAE